MKYPVGMSAEPLAELDALRGGGHTIVTVGNFDGVHIGHARILAEARVLAAELAARVVAISFDPHPAAVLRPDRAPGLLTTLAERRILLERAGADAVVYLRTDRGLLALSGLDFLEGIVARLRPRAFVEGPDFNFGRGRDGSIQTLIEQSERLGFQVRVVPAVECPGLPGQPIARSSAIRERLGIGQVAEAARLLGRPYRIVGRVGAGFGRGAGLGVATANLDDPPQLTPAHGVYACAAQTAAGELHLAAVNIGPQPTFDQMQPRIEAHLLDFQGELRGASLGLHFLDRLRDPVRFAGPTELVRQIQADIAATRQQEGQLANLQAALLPLCVPANEAAPAR